MEFTIKKLHYIAYIGFISGIIGVLGTYVISVARNDVQAWLPYISDAGGDAPQSTIFSFSMIIVSFCFMVGVWICYLLIQERNEKRDVKVLWLNRLLLLSGVGTGAGMIILAVNPTGHLRKDGTWVWPIFAPHMFGAVLMFTSGIGIMGLLLICTYILDYPHYRKPTFYVRCFAVVVGLISGLLRTSSHTRARPRPTKRRLCPARPVGRFGLGLSAAAFCPYTQTDKLKPPPDHPRDYPPNTIISAFSEWLVVITFMVFTLSFVPEFRKLKMDIRLGYDEQRKPLATSTSSLHESTFSKSSDRVV
ncbi:DNA damage-regulated autophagy modulator protein 1-like [Ornithodoros turicata]|uniref:DNA damage-regulated autophagy modulator protein 1-like n=1 Tax=Ornithodoros turicata TaxID=34597 RepID=UPI003138A340